VTVSTAHKAKGPEWPAVKIADDFLPRQNTDQHDAQGPPDPVTVGIWLSESDGGSVDHVGTVGFTALAPP
jgi:hypothetical protein